MTDFVSAKRFDYEGKILWHKIANNGYFAIDEAIIARQKSRQGELDQGCEAI